MVVYYVGSGGKSKKNRRKRERERAKRMRASGDSTREGTPPAIEQLQLQNSGITSTVHPGVDLTDHSELPVYREGENNRRQLVCISHRCRVSEMDFSNINRWFAEVTHFFK